MTAHSASSHCRSARRFTGPWPQVSAQWRCEKYRRIQRRKEKGAERCRKPIAEADSGSEARRIRGRIGTGLPGGRLHLWRANPVSHSSRETAPEKNRCRPDLFPRHTGAERLTDLDRHDFNAVAYGMVDRGQLLRYGHAQSSHSHGSARHLTASRLGRGEGAKETLPGRDYQAGKSTIPEKGLTLQQRQPKPMQLRYTR